MSLPASQQRVLDVMENRLTAREPRLASMFAIFTRLATGEALPWREALQTVPWWSPRRWCPSGHRTRPLGRARAAILLALASVLVITAVCVGMSHSRPGCTPLMGRGPLVTPTHVRNCPAPPQAKGVGHGR